MNNTYFILRHGQARSNKYDFISSWPEKRYNPLTKKGEKQVKKVIKELEKIDLIFSSDVLRTKLTSEMIAKKFNLKVNFDKRLREIDTGIFNGKSIKKWHKFFKNKDRITIRPLKGENYTDIFNRVANFLKEIDKKHKGKNILIISHGILLISIQAFIKNIPIEQAFSGGIIELNTGELKKL